MPRATLDGPLPRGQTGLHRDGPRTAAGPRHRGERMAQGPVQGPHPPPRSHGDNIPAVAFWSQHLPHARPPAHIHTLRGEHAHDKQAGRRRSTSWSIQLLVPPLQTEAGSGSLSWT